MLLQMAKKPKNKTECPCRQRLGSQDEMTLDFSWALNLMTRRQEKEIKDGAIYVGDNSVKTHVKVEGETGVILPQTKECQEPPDAWRSEEGFSPRTPVGLWPCQYLDFRFLLPELTGNRVVLFYPTQFMAICHSSPRRLLLGKILISEDVLVSV